MSATVKVSQTLTLTPTSTPSLTPTPTLTRLRGTIIPIYSVTGRQGGRQAVKPLSVCLDIPFPGV